MSNYTYDNKVIQNKYNTILETELDLNQFCTIDTSLTQGAGDTLRVVYHSVSGAVDEVAMGEGNTNVIEVTGGYNDYILKTTQGKGSYYDEEAQRDPAAIDAMLKGVTEAMTNKWNKDIMGEFNKATLNETAGSLNFAGCVDAIAKFGEQDKDLFGLIHPTSLATLRKALNDDLKYSGDFARTGYIGSVCSVPLYISNDVPKGEIIFANREAVKLIINKQNEIEVERDADHRKSTYFIRTVAVAALANDKKVSRLAGAVTTATTITTGTKATTTIGGAADTGSLVKIYINGKYAGSATAASNAYTFTAAENLVPGDKIIAVAKKDGQVSSTSAEFTVAE